VHELAGSYYFAILGHDLASVGQVYSLTVALAPPVDLYDPIDTPVSVDFGTPPVDESVQTLILLDRARLEQLWPGDATISPLVAGLSELAAHPDVSGTLVELDTYPAVNAAFALWDAEPGNPLAANYVAATLKSLIYRLAPAYPNLEYLVLVGDDRVIPYRRIRDEALLSNERLYAGIAYTPRISESLHLRYFLSDDYYAGLLPLPWKGRELYLPQLGIGRLVESPAEMLVAVNAFLAHPEIGPETALVTGYDFLSDQANRIADVSSAHGLDVETLIGDAWTADDLRPTLLADPRDLGSLNAHFQHDCLLAADGATDVCAGELTGTVDYDGALAFSVGCHSGLNVADDESASLQTGTDWAQAFLRQGATFVGNTGYGYGDSDLVAYSERLMTQFAEELAYWPGGEPQTVGQALLHAKQRYFGSVAADTWSAYDEKVMAEATLYGLPMLHVRLPSGTTDPPGGVSLQAAVSAGEVGTTHLDLAFFYEQHDLDALGAYYTISGSTEVHAVSGRPVLPQTGVNVEAPGTFAHGALLVGGTFVDEDGFDPLISRVVTDHVAAGDDVELSFPMQEWYPAQMGTVNRFLSIDGVSHERLVLVPGQFRATTDAVQTVGVHRRYTELAFEVYHAPYEATDFQAPTIWAVEVAASVNGARFRVRAEDESGPLMRVVVLYRRPEVNTWSMLDLACDPGTGWAAGEVKGFDGPIYYLAQAVDATGNVALALDHGQAFSGVVAHRNSLYLPTVLRDSP